MLNKGEISMLIGEEETLVATVLPENTTDKTVVWSSSDENVVTVSADGFVKAINVGKAVITAKNGDCKAECEVTVNPILANEIVLTTTELSLVKGSTETLIATVSPENTTDKTVIWTSSNESVATVSADGLVTAINVGPAVITATCGEVFATCMVMITPDTHTITYIVDGEVYKTETVEFGATITPIAEPEKEGYTFSGWSEIPETMPANDVIVTGSFAVNTYTITYNIDGEVYKTKTVEFGATITAVAEPSKEGYTFSGWSEIPETMPAHDITVSGTFSVNSYIVTYIVDGEIYHTDTYEYGAGITPIIELTKEGYTFSGWSKIPEKMPAHDVTITGTFTVNTYTITYIVDGGGYQTETYEYGATITPIAEPEKEGHTFSGWSEIPETMPEHDVTVTGTFIVNKYMLRYYDGEILQAEFEVEFGAEIPPYEYNNEEFVFKGWDGDTYETMPAHDIAYHAITIPNGIETIHIDNNAEIKIYDITGSAVYKGNKAEMLKRLKGLYIIKYGDKSIKCRL